MNAVIAGDQLPQVQIRERILRLEANLRQYEQLDLPLKHTFAPGAYAREILLPAGCIVVGKIHKHAHLNIISKGHVTVVTEFGMMEMRGVHTFTSQPGTKRALIAHEDTIWTTIHLTNETDLEKIEDEIIAKSYDELPTQMIEQCLEVLEHKP